MKRHLSPVAALPALLLLVLAGCEASKSSNPLSPTVAGPIAGVEITQPKILEPAFEFRFKESQQPIKLVIENSASSGVRPLTYAFEVSTDREFSNKVYARSGVPQGDGGRTSVVIERLEVGRNYYWRARAEDGANVSAYADASFQVLPRAVLNPPAQHSPISGANSGSRTPILIVGSAERNESVGAVRYEFQVSSTVAFSAVVSSGVKDEDGGTTGFTTSMLDDATTYYWRVRASDGETTSNWSGAESFRTPSAAIPGPGPSPGPTNPGGPCNFSTGEAIVQCERAKYGHMDSGQLVQLLQNIADSLNRNNIPGGRFGLLRKSSGHNCLGYSCDILCAGNGPGQRQWDVIGDVDGAQSAGWGEVPPQNVTVRVCEIR